MNIKLREFKNIVISKYMIMTLCVIEHFFNMSEKKLSMEELRILKNRVLNYKYENSKDFLSVDIPVVKTNDETLDKLLKEKNSICRYGDGEFNLMKGNSILFQNYSAKLAQRLREIIKSNPQNILVGIPGVFGEFINFKEADRAIGADFWREYLVKNRDVIYNFLNLGKTYYNAFITRPYMDCQDASKVGDYFAKLKQLWVNRDIVFVEGKKSRLGVGNDLFDNAKSIQRILCPEKDAFSRYDEILTEILKQDKNKLILLALGPTATVLAYDLAQAGYQAIDSGHVDIEYEWFLAKAVSKVKIKNKYVNEAKDGREASDFIFDEKYNNEIIKVIE